MDSWLNNSPVDVVVVLLLLAVVEDVLGVELLLVLVVLFVFEDVVPVDDVGRGVVIGILTGVVVVNSLVTKMGRLCMSVKSWFEAEMLNILEADEPLFSSLVVDVELKHKRAQYYYPQRFKSISRKNIYFWGKRK